MKALLIKDWYVIKQSMRLFLIMLGIFAVIPGMNLAGIALVYAVMVPINAMSYDERAKWERYAGAMPFQKRTVVLERYVLGYIGIAVTVLLMLFSTLVGAAVRADSAGESLRLLWLLVGGALLIQAIGLPPMYKHGVEKGRMALLVVMGLMGACAFVLGSVAPDLPEMTSTVTQALDVAMYAMPPVAIAAQLISIRLSLRFYQKREM